MRRIAVPLILSIPILFYSCGHRTAGKQSVSYPAGTASIIIDDKEESSDFLEETVDVPEYILRWQEEHRVSDEIIESRIQSALKDSSRLNALSYDEMTVDAETETKHKAGCIWKLLGSRYTQEQLERYCALYGITTAQALKWRT